MNVETLITLGYYISSLGFLIASYVTFSACRTSKPSGLKTVLTYLCIGTVAFFAITIFQKIAGSVYGISDESVDIWWHVMFYIAMFSFYMAFKTLAGLGSSTQSAVSTSGGKTVAIVTGIVLLAIFIIPTMADPYIQGYENSRLAELGAHHFLAFIIAGIVGAYVFSAKIFLGEIGRAIASPMIVAIWALSIQHFWELLTESWAVIELTSDVIEGVEKIFLTIAAVCIIAAGLRLKKFVQA